MTHNSSLLVFDNARDGDVRDNFSPIVFRVSDGSTTKNCDHMCIACTNVEIRNDFTIEDKFENFSLSLSHRDPAVFITSETISVTIEDEDSQFLTESNRAWVYYLVFLLQLCFLVGATGNH